MTIDNVSGGELIDPAWGNSVADTLNAAEFVDFVPSFNASLTIGDGTYTAKYCYLSAKLMYLYFSLNFGSTTAVSGNVQLTFPDSAVRDADLANMYLGGASFNDSGVTTYEGFVRSSTSNSVCDILALDASSTYVRRSVMSATVPFTWTSGDALSFFALVPLA